MDSNEGRRIKEADLLMQKQIAESSTTDWQADKTERIKAADELMQAMINKK